MSDGGARRSFARAAAGGSLVALVVDLWILLGGHLTLLRRAGQLGSFFDIQARALLHGHLAIPPGSIGIEGFVLSGHTYEYYGPVPALGRLPLLALTHRYDGRLTELSLLLALLVLLWATAHLHWRLRRLVAPDAALDRPARTAVFLIQLAVGAGSVVTFLLGWLSVYHETELWGAALSVAAFSAIVGVLLRPRARGILWAGVLAALAVNTRVSVGLGPIVGLGCVTLAAGVKGLASFGPAAPVRRGLVALLAFATLVPLLSSVAVNEAKFGRAFGIPLNRQIDSQSDPTRRAVLAANHGSLFGAKFVPTTLLQTVRPDALGSTRAFPWVGVPRHRPRVVGHVLFDGLEESLSAPTSMALLCVLFLVGLVAIVRRRRLRPLAGLIAGAAIAYVPALTIAYVATRYLADLLPLLLLGGLVGVSVALERPRRLLLPGLAAGCLLGIVVNASTGLVLGRLLVPNTSRADRAAFVSEQDRIDSRLGRRPHGISTGAGLPAEPGHGAPGDLFDVGRCDGLYVLGRLDTWLPVERTARTGTFRVRLRPGASSGAQPVFTLGDLRLDATSAGARRTFALHAGGHAFPGPAVTLPGGRDVELAVSVDPLGPAHFASVELGGRTVASGFVPYRLGTPPQAGPAARILPGTAPVCRRLARRAGLPGA
jgi:hypothetical protein